MMDFAPHTSRRKRGENIVPMINVVFLLLIFFLMSAQIAPPDPFEVQLPNSSSTTDRSRADVLYVSADGTLSFNDAAGDAALERLAERVETGPLLLQVDASFSAADLAALLPKLALAGVTETRLVTGGR